VGPREKKSGRLPSLASSLDLSTWGRCLDISPDSDLLSARLLGSLADGKVIRQGVQAIGLFLEPACLQERVDDKVQGHMAVLGSGSEGNGLAIWLKYSEGLRREGVTGL
jgi:hypothetical protein